MSKRPPNHPDRFNPATPEWMRNSVLPTRLVNVLVAGHYGNENILRGTLTTQTGRQLLFKLPNMGKKGMAELRDWAGVSISAAIPSDKELLDWLNRQPVHFIELDDFSIIDVRGMDIRAAIAKGRRLREIANIAGSGDE